MCGYIVHFLCSLASSFTIFILCFQMENVVYLEEKEMFNEVKNELIIEIFFFLKNFALSEKGD